MVDLIDGNIFLTIKRAIFIDNFGQFSYVIPISGISKLQLFYFLLASNKVGTLLAFEGDHFGPQKARKQTRFYPTLNCQISSFRATFLPVFGFQFQQFSNVSLSGKPAKFPPKIVRVEKKFRNFFADFNVSLQKLSGSKNISNLILPIFLRNVNIPGNLVQKLFCRFQHFNISTFFVM